MSETPANQDEQHLTLLSIFHYVVAGVAAFCSFFPLLYTVMGFAFLAFSQHPPANPTQSAPPAALGWFFIGFGIFFAVLGLFLRCFYSWRAVPWQSVAATGLLLWWRA